MDCGACGEPNRPGAAFCDACGTALEPGADDARRRAAPAAERRLVTVLFADAESSTALTEQIGDEAAYRLMQDCTARMTAAVERHHGTVTQFRGDGVMALFGAPVAIEDAAVQAVTAALDLQADLSEYRAEMVDRLGVGCDFRIGVNTGRVVVGRLGEDTLVDYTAIGDTANVAARMEQVAAAGTVYLSDATRRAVRNFIDCAEVGELAVKGKSSPVRTWRAVARRPVRSRLQAAVARGLSPLVGRARELDLLSGLVDRARSGQGQVAVITGPAGIGKSRLLWELRTRLSANVGWYQGGASAEGQTTPWHLVADVLRQLLGVTERDDPGEVAAVIRQRAEGWSVTGSDPVPWLAWVLHAGGEELESLDPRDRRAGVYQALRTLLDAEASRRPLVVAVEDLHWADEASTGAVSELARAVSAAPALLIVTCRPGHDADLGDQRWLTRLALDELGEGDSADLAARALDGPLPDELRALVAERAEGNPLFIEELVTSLPETSVIERRGGGWALSVPVEEITLPATLQEVVLARIDRLPLEAREGLQLASVIGREFSWGILDRIVTAPEHLDGHLATLESLELVRRTSERPEIAYRFKHTVVHEVTYSTLLEDRRRDLHHQVAEAIEDLATGRLDEHAPALARHWLEAGDPRRALPHLVGSGTRALAGYSIADAVGAFDRAIDIADELADDERLVEVCERRIEVARLVADMPTCVTVGDRMRQAARRLGRPETEALALCARGKAELFMHRFDEAGRTLTEAIAIGEQATEETGEMDGIVLAGVWQGLSLAMRGYLDDATTLWHRTRPPDHEAHIRASTLGELRATDQIVANWRGRWDVAGASELVEDMELGEGLLDRWIEGLAAAGRGDYAEALAGLEELVEISQRLGEPLARARALNTIGWVHFDLGDLAGAEELNRSSVDLVAPLTLPNPGIEHNARLNLADIHRARGDLDAAVVELAAVERVVRDPTTPEQWMLWRYSQHWFATSGETRLARGDPDTALERADECLDLAARTMSRKYLVRGGRLRCRALLALGRSDEAEVALDDAVAMAREVANPPELWRALGELASLLDATGREAVARRVAREALEVIDTVACGLGDHPLAGCLRRSAGTMALTDLAG